MKVEKKKNDVTKKENNQKKKSGKKNDATKVEKKNIKKDDVTKIEDSKKKKKVSILTILCALADFVALTLFFVVYGPFDNFKNWWITTALETGHHKYFANVLYSDAEIERIAKESVIVETSDDTNTSEITFDNTDTNNYESAYEEQILKRDKDAIYKLITIDEKDYNGYMVVIYDPARISLYTSSKIKSGGQGMLQMAKEAKAKVAINASGFSHVGSALIPHGTVIKNGKIASVGRRNTHGGGLIGFTKNHVLMLSSGSAESAIKKGMYNAMTFGPFLIVNGKATNAKGNGADANRTAIAQRKDGIVLFLVIDGRGANGSKGISYQEMITLFQKYNAYNAANLDGGGSSILVIDNKIVNNPRGYGYAGDRYLPNAWIVR